MRTSQKVSKNTGILLGAQIISKIIQFFTVIVMVRYLGDSDFGRYSFILAYALLFSVLADMGINAIAIREISRKSKQMNLLLGNVLTLKIILSILAIGTLLISSLLIGFTNYMLVAIVIVSLSILFVSLSDTLFIPFQIRLKMKYQGYATITEFVTFALGIYLVVLINLGLIGTLFTYLISKIANALSAYYFSLKITSFKLNFDKKKWRSFLVAGFPLGASLLFITMFEKVGTVLLGSIATFSDVGYYTAAEKLIQFFTLIPMALITSIYPLMSVFSQKSKERLIMTYKLSSRYLLFIGIPITCGIFVLSQHIIASFYGSEFLPAYEALAILCLPLPITFLNILFSSIFNAINKQKVVGIVCAFTVILNVALNLLLIPSLRFRGVAIATVLTYTFGFIVGYSLLRRYLKVGIDPVILPKPVFCAISMGIILWYVHTNLLLRVLLGALIYIALMMLTRAITREDIERLPIHPSLRSKQLSKGGK